MISENKKYKEFDEDSQYRVPVKNRDKKNRPSKGRRRFDDGEYVKKSRK